MGLTRNFPQLQLLKSKSYNWGTDSRFCSTWSSTTNSIYLERSRRVDSESSIIVIISYRFEKLFRVKVRKSPNRPQELTNAPPPLTLIITFIKYLDTSRDDKHFTHRKFSYPTSGSWRCSTGEKWIHHIFLIFSTGESWQKIHGKVWILMITINFDLYL